MAQTFNNFAALAAHLRAEQHKADIAAAAKLRRASALPGPKVGPKVAR